MGRKIKPLMTIREQNYQDNYENYKIKDCLICGQDIDKFLKTNGRSKHTKGPNVVTCCPEHSRRYQIICKRYSNRIESLRGKIITRDKHLKKFKEENDNLVKENQRLINLVEKLKKIKY